MRWVVWALPVVALLSACGGSISTSTPTAEPADGIVTQAQEAIAAVSSYRFSWERVSRETETGETTSESTTIGEGEWAAPDASRVRSTHLADIGSERFEEVAIEGESYRRTLPDGEWGTVDAPAAVEFGLDAFRAGDWELVDNNAELGGELVYLIRGTEDLPIGNGFIMTNTTSVWLDKEDFLPRRLEMRGRTNASEKTIESNTAMRFYDYNARITIAAPDVGVVAEPVDDDSVTAEDIIALVQEASAEIQSYRFSTDLFSPDLIRLLDGEWVAPDAFRVEIIDIQDGTNIRHEEVTVGNTSYRRSQPNGTWSLIESPTVFATKLPDLDGAAWELMDGSAEVFGQAVYHLRSIATTDGMDSGTVDVYIGVDDRLPKLIETQGAAGSGESSSTRFLLYNMAFSINLPAQE